MRIPIQGSRQETVNSTGATAGSVLKGVGPHNRDLLLPPPGQRVNCVCGAQEAPF